MDATQARNPAVISTASGVSSIRQLVLVVLLAWISMLGVDFFLHGELLAVLYQQESGFLLPPAQAFALIPLGYAAFLLMAILLVWLMTRIDVKGALQGAIFGLKLGALVWGALALGLLSISTASLALVAGWFAGQTIELAVAGALVGAAREGMRLRRLFAWVLAGIVLLVIITVALQSLGLAPATRI
jgi:hypothetical protein